MTILPSLPNTSGIYKITNTVSGKCYIGSSANFNNRWAAHRSLLRANKHHSISLQRAYNKYGELNFVYEVVEVVVCVTKIDTVKLFAREQHYIDTIHPYYNSAPVSGSTLGFKQSEETKEKNRVASTGRKHTEETKAKMRAAQKGRKPMPHVIAASIIANTGRHRERHSDASYAQAAETRRQKPPTERMKAAWATASERTKGKCVNKTPEQLQRAAIKMMESRRANYNPLTRPLQSKSAKERWAREDHKHKLAVTETRDCCQCGCPVTRLKRDFKRPAEQTFCSHSCAGKHTRARYS